MCVGDLVRPKKSYMGPEILGIVTEIEHGFYSSIHASIGRPMNRLHIMWCNGTISLDPETYVDVIASIQEAM